MTRPLRIEYPGAFYHVTTRGNAKKDIFQSDADRDLFLQLLTETNEKYNWLCHSLCLMNNHYHLLIETVDPTLSKGMKYLNGLYTQRYHYEHGTVGHIFQGRYKAFLIEEEFYLLNVARYIVLNPVRAGIVNDPATYVWSSYRGLAGLEPKQVWLTTDNILRRFADYKGPARDQYRLHVMEGIGLTSPLKEASGGILGTDQFVDEMRDQIKDKEIIKEIVIKERMDGRPTLVELFDGVETIEDRNLTIALALGRLQYSGAEVGRFLRLDASSVCRIARWRLGSGLVSGTRYQT